MQDTRSLKQLFELLARLYGAEGRHGGDEAATALRVALSSFPRAVPEPYNYLPGVAEAALALDPHPDAAIVAKALPSIRWFHVVDSLQSIGADMGNRSKHPGETAGVFELILGGAPLGSQLDCRRVSTDGGGLCGLISLLGRRPVPGE